MDIKTFDSRPIALPIEKIIKENETVNTYVFEYSLHSRPGQFVMLWIPGVDEKPFSIAFDDRSEFWLTICNVGPATEDLFKLKEGDKVGIRGPFGTAYECSEGDSIALVAGGYGAAPMYFAMKEALKKNCTVNFFIGARSKDHLLYTQKIAGYDDVGLHIATDDGSVGHEGYVTHNLENFCKKNKVDRLFTCGPELMMKAACEIGDKYGADCYLSMEKYMKCGIGVCGQCAIDDTGVLACKSGPVMRYKDVKDLPEFGSYHRDAQGKKHKF